MARRAPQILLASVLALYGAVSLCGPALHALPGCDHAAGRADAGHDAPSVVLSADDCPICHFLSQGQLAADRGDGRLVEVLAIAPADDPPPTERPGPAGPSSPRAPPRA